MEYVEVNGNGYMHVHMAILDNTLWFGDSEDHIMIGEGLTQFLYADVAALRNRVHYNTDDFDSVHPYFKNCSEEWKKSFVHHIEGTTRIARMPDIERILELQNIYREVLNSLFRRQNPYEDKHFVDDKITSGMLQLGTACFSSMRLEEGGSLDYFVSTFEECLFLEFAEILKRKIIFKSCKNCERLFIPKRKNMDYCPRIYTEDGKTCAEVGYTRTFAENVRNDELLAAYTRAYKAHYARMTKPRKKSANMTREEFEAWYKEAKNKLDLARAGHIDTESFKEWLKI